VSLLIFSVGPLGLVIAFSVLLGLWLAPCHTEGRKKEKYLLRFGDVLAVFGVSWLAALGLKQGLLPVVTPGQLLASLGVLNWAGHSYVQHRISERKLTIFPLVATLLLISTGLVAGLQTGASIPQALIPPRAAVHIALSLLAITLLVGSGLFGAGELILGRQIKRRRFDRWFHDLPSLSDLNHLRRVALTAGLGLLSLSLLSAMATLWLMPDTREVTISHLHPMLSLWVILTVLWTVDRFQWAAQLKLAAASMTVAALMIVLIVVSVIEFFGGAAT
jgi:ABC-type uncharacterized transport system permease subunit